MEYREEDFLLLSGIQHFSFCRRQWALIHIEQQWEENLRTIEGDIFHEIAHDGLFAEKRGDLIISRGMKVFSYSLGFTGSCDIVELYKTPDGVEIFGRDGKYKPIPIEYKRGKPKENDADALQLCAQAMCLEEMMLCEIPEAFLFYGETRHRHKIILDNDLRQKVKAMSKEMHELYDRRYTPKVKPSKACKACSLTEICMPRLCKNISVKKYIEKNLMGVEE
jgi:CRISPR-associated exonuclease Cas4